MSKEEQELLLTTARILRAHLRDCVPISRDQMQDIQDLNHALRPFESNVTALHPNADEKS
jgi:hypothetical protein